VPSNSVASVDNSHLDSLNEQVKQLLETNKQLVVSLRSQSAQLELLKNELSESESRIGNVEYQAIWQSNSVNNVVAYFADRLDRHQSAISNLLNQVFFINLKSDNTEAVFDAANSTGFSRVNTDSGFFLVSLKNAEPYLDGYKITLDVGNPLSADYQNAKYQVAWGKKFDVNDYTNNSNSYQAWVASLHSKEISSSDNLMAGTWNKVQLVLSPAKSDELGYISIKFSTTTAMLRQPFKTTP
jgi:hypothetical protein